MEKKKEMEQTLTDWLRDEGESSNLKYALDCCCRGGTKCVQYGYLRETKTKKWSVSVCECDTERGGAWLNICMCGKTCGHHY